MSPVIGLDILKGESQGQAFLDTEHPQGKNLSFLDKKLEEGKSYRVAILACVNKLLHWISCHEK